MMWTRRLWLKLQGLFRRNRNAQRLEDEIQFHLDQQIAENLAAGMSPQEAGYAAMRAFGNPTKRSSWVLLLRPITAPNSAAPSEEPNKQKRNLDRCNKGW